MGRQEPDGDSDAIGARTLAGEALVGRCIAGVAHDLATPLSTVSLRAELLLTRLQRQGTPEAEKDARALHTIVEAVARCSQLLTALRGLARAWPPGPEALLLGPVVEAALEVVASPARHRSLKLAPAPDLAQVGWRLPRGPVQQAVLGLVAHAVDGAESGSVVSIEAEAGEALVLRVRAKGIAAASDSRDLAAAREAAGALGGTLRVEDDAAGGSLVLVVPAGIHAAGAAASRADEPPDGFRRRDEPDAGPMGATSRTELLRPQTPDGFRRQDEPHAGPMGATSRTELLRPQTPDGERP